MCPTPWSTDAAGAQADGVAMSAVYQQTKDVARTCHAPPSDSRCSRREVKIFLQRVYSCEAVLDTRSDSFCAWCRRLDSRRRVPALHVVYRPLARTDRRDSRKSRQNDAPRLCYNPSPDRSERQTGPLIVQAPPAPLQIASSPLQRACLHSRVRLPSCGAVFTFPGPTRIPAFRLRTSQRIAPDHDAFTNNTALHHAAASPRRLLRSSTSRPCMESARTPAAVAC